MQKFVAGGVLVALILGSLPAPIDPSLFSDEQWRNRLTRFRDDKTWLEAWGAEPGKPGCLVPSHLLLTPVKALPRGVDAKYVDRSNH
jgi:hypothetical protein